jgi:hypothetical protein
MVNIGLFFSSLPAAILRSDLIRLPYGARFSGSSSPAKAKARPYAFA